MSQRLRQGWQITKRHMKLIVLLFIYQALWGFILFRLVDKIISPIMLRYPAVSGNIEDLQLFWAEIQFRSLKTDMLEPYLYGLLIMLLLRMLITPIIQSGVFHSIHAMSSGEQQSSFLKGIRACWKPMMLIYWLKSIAILVPVFWLFSPFMREQDHSLALQTFLNTSVWIWLLLVLWIAIISLVGYAIQLGIGARLSLLQALMLGLKHLGKILLIALIIFAIYGLISASVHAIAMLWVTLISFVLYQLLPLVRSTCSIWLISSQYSAISHNRS